MCRPDFVILDPLAATVLSPYLKQLALCISLKEIIQRTLHSVAPAAPATVLSPYLNSLTMCFRTHPAASVLSLY